jgi:hypothetical protein
MPMGDLESIELTEAEPVGLMASDETIRAETAHNILAPITDQQHVEWMRSQGADEEAIREYRARRARLGARAPRRCRTSVAAEKASE